MAKTWLQKYGTYEEETTGEEMGITAYAGGGQANAYQLTKKWNEVSTVATTDDSIKLPLALTGKQVFVLNNGANDLKAYPQSGEYMSGVLNGGASISASGYGTLFICIKDTYWNKISII